MVEFCDLVIAYTAGYDLATWRADRMRYDATLRNVELIGEAATRVPDELRALAPEVPWRQIIGTRNRIAHGYLGIEPETAWVIASNRVPTLRVQLKALLASLDREAP